MENPETTELAFNDIDPEILADLLDFIYKDSINDLGSKAEKVLVEAIKVCCIFKFCVNQRLTSILFQFGLSRLILLCEKTLLENATVPNALQTMVLAKECKAENLIKSIANFIRM